MTLEDFFTLTEMKDGLTSLARVDELISIMQQQKDCVIHNVPDTTRQWSSVAGTLAATENKDCLNRFVKLNGLYYLNHWLQEALKFSNEVTELAVEELLNSFLGSLGRLPVYREDLVASGIQLTIRQLVGFKSIDVKEKARALSERWKFAMENGVSDQDMNEHEKQEDDNLKPSSDVGPADAVNPMNPVFDNSKDVQGESNCREECAGAGCQSHCSNVEEHAVASQLDNTDDAPTSTENKIIPCPCSAVGNTNPQAMDVSPSAFVPNFCQGNLSGTGDSSFCPAVEMGSSATCCSDVRADLADGHSDASVLKNDGAEDRKMEVDTKGASPSKSCQPESSKVSSSSGLSVTSHAHKPERSLSCNFDAKEIKSHALGTTETLPRSLSIACVGPEYLKSIDLKPDMQCNGSKLRIFDDAETSPDKKEEFAGQAKIEGVISKSKLNFSRIDTVPPCDSSKSSVKKSTIEMDESTELGLEYGEIDALEVARQVAIEVEREVVDYREQFCTSSPDNSGEDMSPHCSDERPDQPLNEEQNVRGSPCGRDLGGASLHKDENLKTAEIDPSHDRSEQDTEISEPITQESGDKTDQVRCVFDLNEDICVDESDCLMNSTPNNSVNVTAPIVVAASKGAPVLPVVPLRFEGELGWKGSAATSAFRPASPRRTLDVEKTSSGHKRKANMIEFDLNVAESGDDAIDPLSVKPTPVSCSIPSQEDSAEVSSRRADRLKLDLNRLGDEDVLPLPSPYWSLPHQNGDRTMSPASSSSSRHPTRDFDLNDNPSYFDALGSYNLNRFSSKSSGMNAGSKPDNPVITIMGSRITERKAYPGEAPLSFIGNGPSTDATTMASRTVIPYSHIQHSAYGYNGPVMGPPMPFPPHFYAPGSIPYMVDSRGATVVPQILSTSGLNNASSALPPFLLSMPSTSPGFGGTSTSHSGLDLKNSGLMSLETGSREGGNLKNFFAQGHSGSMEGQMRVASLPATAGTSVNLKESDSGWGPYTFGYKQANHGNNSIHSEGFSSHFFRP